MQLNKVFNLVVLTMCKRLPVLLAALLCIGSVTGDQVANAHSAKPLHPELSESKTYAYALDGLDGILQFIVNSQRIAALTSASLPQEADFLTADPDGRFVYAGDLKNVWCYRIDQSGLLSQSDRVLAMVTKQGYTEQIVFNSAADSAYLINVLGDVYACRTETNGTFHLLSKNPTPGSPGVMDAALSANGRNLYVLTQNIDIEHGNAAIGYGALLYQYSIKANHKVVPMTPDAVNVGIDPKNIAVDPAGKYLYVSNKDGIGTYLIEKNGALHEVDQPVPCPTCPGGTEQVPVDQNAAPTPKSLGAISNLVISNSGEFAYSTEFYSAETSEQHGDFGQYLDFYRRDKDGRLVLIDRRIVSKEGLLDGRGSGYGDIWYLAFTPDNTSLVAVDSAYNKLMVYALKSDGTIVNDGPRSVTKAHQPGRIEFVVKKAK